MECLDTWCQYFGVFAEHPEGENTLTILQNMSSFASVLSSSFGSSHHPRLLGLVCMEGCKFMAPLDLDDDLRRLPDGATTIFQKQNTTIIERLKAPVAGAAFVNKVTKTGSGSDPSKSKGQPKAKAARKAKAKPKAAAAGSGKPSEAVEDRDDIEGDVKMNMADSRPRWWLDDLLGCLLHASKGQLQLHQ